MQPESGFEYLQVNAAGSAIVKSREGQLKAVICNQAYTGTTILYDNPSGTSSVEIARIANPAGAATLDFCARVKNGIYHLSTGTPQITLIYK